MLDMNMIFANHRSRKAILAGTGHYVSILINETLAMYVCPISGCPILFDLNELKDCLHSCQGSPYILQFYF